jgi:hypothetical protein
MNKNWLFTSIFGDEEPSPSRSLPRIPIVDDAPPLFPRARNPRTDALIQKLETESAIKAVCGAEVLELMKDRPGDPRVEPSYNTYVQQDLRIPVPEHVADPRKIECQCSCPMCQSGSGCWNCLGDEGGVKCEFHSLSFLTELMPVSNEQRDAEMAQAAKRQRVRFARRSQTAAKRHREGLAPAFKKLRDSIPYSSARIDEALNHVHDSAAQCVADVVAMSA